jgi:hypothetical protein
MDRRVPGPRSRSRRRPAALTAIEGEPRLREGTPVPEPMIISSKFGFLPTIQGKFILVRLSQSGLKGKKEERRKKDGAPGAFPFTHFNLFPI